MTESYNPVYARNQAMSRFAEALSIHEAAHHLEFRAKPENKELMGQVAKHLRAQVNDLMELGIKEWQNLEK